MLESLSNGKNLEGILFFFTSDLIFPKMDTVPEVVIKNSASNYEAISLACMSKINSCAEVSLIPLDWRTSPSLSKGDIARLVEAPMSVKEIKAKE